MTRFHRAPTDKEIEEEFKKAVKSETTVPQKEKEPKGQEDKKDEQMSDEMPDILIPPSESSINLEIQDKVMSSNEPRYLNRYADLNEEQIILLSKFEHRAKVSLVKFGLDTRLMFDLPRRYKAHTVSKNRLGRTEIVQMETSEDLKRDEKIKSMVKELVGK